MTQEKQLPVTILTGFLGAGKTTFLNHTLRTYKDIRYAIIENEYGEQSIDGELVIRPEETIVELNNGCLCCTLNDNLYDILNVLFDRRNEFDEIIIEATGVADPSGLAEPFLYHPLIKEQFPLKGIVCLVDAELIEDQLKETEEARAQVAFSDILIINKTDLVTRDYLHVLAEKLKGINPLASVVFGNKNDFPSINYDQDSILEGLFRPADHAVKLPENKNQFPVTKPHSHHHHEHTKDIISLAFSFDQPFILQALINNFFVYLMLQSAGLYRMKGLFYVENSDEQYVLQSVGKRLDVEVKRRWETGEFRKSTVVFIGKNLGREKIKELLDQCVFEQTNSSH